MAKEATNRQIETAKRELDRAVHSVVEAWRTSNPRPSWEQEREWEELNPSPYRRHAKLEREFSRELEAEADALMVRIKMGEVKSDEAYSELRQALDRFNAIKLSLLNK